MNILKTGSMLLVLVLFVQTGLALKCYACNSVVDKGCTYKKFEPTLSTNVYPKCESSMKDFFEQAKYSVYHYEYEKFDVKQLIEVNASSDACFKMTLKGKDSPKEVTFRGCSVFGNRTCELFEDLLDEGTIVNCDQRQKKAMSNYARSTLPLVSAYLMAAIALAIAIKF